MASNKDIKEMLEARKTRRTIPQIDPAETLTQPEPEIIEPAVTDPGKSLELSEPQPSAKTTSNDQPTARDLLTSSSAKYLNRKKNDKVNRTFQYRPSRLKQLDKEVKDTSPTYWQIIDIALELYFHGKYGDTSGEDERQR